VEFYRTALNRDEETTFRKSRINRNEYSVAHFPNKNFALEVLHRGASCAGSAEYCLGAKRTEFVLRLNDAGWNGDAEFVSQRGGGHFAGGAGMDFSVFIRRFHGH
jgi:hypothetical protein